MDFDATRDFHMLFYVSRRPDLLGNAHIEWDEIEFLPLVCIG